MAAPPEVSMKDLTGKWTMNKTLSDDTDAVLQLQGVSWMMRRAIAWATITLAIRQYRDPDRPDVTHIDTDQTATGGIKSQELRTLDWTDRPHQDRIFGSLVGKSRWIAPDSGADWEALNPYMRDGWLEEPGCSHVQSWVANEEREWTAEQIWGFAVVEDQRYHVRRVVVKKGDQALSVRLVYDWQGKE